MEKVILHCDMNNFYASVECILNPSIKNYPLAVCGNPRHRHGIVLAKNMTAKKLGIQTGEVIWQAKQKCPNLICVAPHHEVYEQYSKKAKEIYSRYTNFVEGFGPDECWLDVTQSTKLFGSGKEIADKIREDIKRELKLTVSVGVSFTKVYAKLGSDYKKPDATTCVTKENFSEIMFPLPAQALIMVGRHTNETLKKLNINTIKDLYYADQKLLTYYLGKHGKDLINMVRGEDDFNVQSFATETKFKSVGNGTTTPKDIQNFSDAKPVVYRLCKQIAERLRINSTKCTGVAIAIKNVEMDSFSRQTVLKSPTYTDLDIAKTALDLLKKSWNFNKSIRSLTITAINLIADDSSEQISMFELEKPTKKDDLNRCIDILQDKYGKDTLKRAILLDGDFIDDEMIDIVPLKE
ncbi:MAG: DNA polymerase IV [Clostridia bacterium]|nr:DNA polymerase IV [Clostridia bacterium]